MRSRIRFALIWAPVLGIFLFALAEAQTKGPVGSLKGKVKERNGKSLESVTIRATPVNTPEEKRETKSDGKGEFEFVDLPPGARIEVRRGAHPVRLVRLQEAPFTDRLVAKFGLPVEGWRAHGQRHATGH